MKKISKFRYILLILLFINIYGCAEEETESSDIDEETLISETNFIGTWEVVEGVTLTFLEGFTYEMSSEVTGTYTLSGNKITFLDSNSPCGDSPGEYAFLFNQNKDQVSFVEIEDSCEDRKTRTHEEIWSRQP